MYRLFGSILILVACLAFGFQKSFELQSHMEELEELKRIFILIKNEIQYTKSAFGEMFYCISNKAEGIYKDWLRRLSEDLEKRDGGTFLEIWKQAVFLLHKDLHLTKTELTELKQIGSNLSNVDSLDLYLGQLDLAIEKARKEAADKRKIYQSMGVLGGIFLIIILL